jgi:hypothetical protein
MNAHHAHEQITGFYKAYLRSFLNIRDERLREEVEKAFERNELIPEPLIQFNPSYARSESLADLVREGAVHPELQNIFGSFQLYRHQVEALKKGCRGESFVVTSGTGSGKSLTYLATVFDHILKSEQRVPGVKAILVYPMNALINSQEEEIAKYACNYLKQFVADPEQYARLEREQPDKRSLIRALEQLTGKSFPVKFRKYTGQEGQEEREQTKAEQPDIILTNYMMLELIMTRHNDAWLRQSLAEHLRFLVFDELHTYRGRQGSDVSMLIRRMRQRTGRDLIYIGTSATMSSEGGQEDQKAAVARVASTIFGTRFQPEQVVGEYLETGTRFSGQLPEAEELRSCIKDGIPETGDEQLFKVHPLAIWVENKIAIDYSDPQHPKRGQPRTLLEIEDLLAEHTRLPHPQCQAALLRFLRWAEHLNIEGSKQSPPKSYLPFKFHQFISQTGTLYVTLEERGKRAIRLKTERYVVDEYQQEKLLYPVLFSRFSGHDFLCVELDFETGTIKPRDPDDFPPQIRQADVKGDRAAGLPAKKLKETDFPGGYIILPLDEQDDFWSEQEVAYLQDSWLNAAGQPNDFYKYRIPRKLYFDTSGEFSFEPGDQYGLWGWYMPAKLLFDPTAGVIYDLKTKEYTKLMRLGNEGRSTATTLLSFGVLKALFDQGVSAKNRKLLSFTDNRQDASLQAGHFNDFVATAQLRSAIYHALRQAPGQALDYGNIADEVFKALALPEQEYAENPTQLAGWGDEENERALKAYLFIRVIDDLKRGWRYNLPNLEQCGLLEVGYKRLGEFCAQQHFWEGLPLLAGLPPEKREAICLQVLDYFRTSYALEHRYLLDERQELENRLKSKLNSNSVWSLDKDERIEAPFTMVVRKPKQLPKRLYVKTLGTHSNIGKYFKRVFSELELEPLRGQEHDDFMAGFCDLLAKGGFLKPVDVRGKDATVTGYRLRVDQVRWACGNGQTVRPDEVRISAYKNQIARPNEFFRDFYQQDFKRFDKQISGREHTGQLTNDDRISREADFRRGKLSALFCSPTMELGIDIAELSIVHMRNVPPTPANYAQRSGRAGRSGQAALVFTYCSTFSPHDRNYFEQQQQMVAGIVVPPQIDLVNEELILSHMNAYFLMELGLQDLRYAVPEVLDLKDSPGYPIRKDIKHYIEDQLRHYKDRWVLGFREAIASILPELQEAYWFSDAWLLQKANSFLTRFDQSFERWRALYRAADRMIERARMAIDDPTIKRTSDTYLNAKREHAIGLKRKEGLFNDNKHIFGSQSEFYIFRYLAAEGFLPGYNFTRLPVRAFLGKRAEGAGEYISRPRFIAIREFGPHSLIYHNGSKYVINAMNLEGPDLKLERLKVSKATGYAFLNDAADTANNDPITRQELRGQDKVLVVNNVVELTESNGYPQQRITSEEEERSKTRFDIRHYFSYPQGIESTRKAVIKQQGTPLLNLIYGPSTSLIQHNVKRAASPAAGFLINRVSGVWLRQKDLENPETMEAKREVELYTQDTADTLYIQPVQALGLSYEGVVTLAFALKRAIEAQFQVEDSEIGVWVMGEKEDSNILLFESAEGSLGILSQLIDNTLRLKALFYRAYERLHFDPSTYEDRGKEQHIPKASYLDLLSYYNQPYHYLLDRHLVKEALERLMDCDVDNQQGGHGSLEAQYRYLLDNYDLNSGTERKFLDFLFEQGIRLPDRAQVLIPDFYASADFVYKTDAGYTLIFCDGAVHDQPTVQEGDQHKYQLLRDAGYDVIVWHHREPLEALVQRRKDLFRKIR